MVKIIDIGDLTDVKYLRQVLDDIRKNEYQYIIEKNGQPQAALLSLDDLELLRKARFLKERTWDNLFENLRRVHARNLTFSAEEVETDVDEAIKELRT
jgi:PHD/YefM family antitoxin component YafN of YafNO toxin-antitoxin module